MSYYCETRNLAVGYTKALFTKYRAGGWSEARS